MPTSEAQIPECIADIFVCGKYALSTESELWSQIPPPKLVAYGTLRLSRSKRLFFDVLPSKDGEITQNNSFTCVWIVLTLEVSRQVAGGCA